MNKTYRLKCGETLRKVAYKFGFDLEKLIKLNPGVHPDRYYADRIINIY